MAGKEVGPRGLSNIIMEEEEEEEIEGERRSEEQIQDGLVVEDVMMVNFLLVPFPLVSFPSNSCSEVFPGKEKFNEHIVQMQKDQTSCIIC